VKSNAATAAEVSAFHLLPSTFRPLSAGPPIIHPNVPTDVAIPASVDSLCANNLSATSASPPSPVRDCLETKHCVGASDILQEEELDRSSSSLPDSAADEAEAEDIETSFRVQGYDYNIPKPHAEVDSSTTASATLHSGVHVYYRRTAYMLDVREQMRYELMVISTLIDRYNAEHSMGLPVHAVVVR